MLFADHILRRILLYDEDGTLDGWLRNGVATTTGGFRSVEGCRLGAGRGECPSESEQRAKARLTVSAIQTYEPDTAMQVGAVIGTLGGTAGGYVADVYASRDGDRLKPS